MTLFKLSPKPFRLLATTIAVAFALWLPLAAQQVLDRSKIPPPGKTPVFHVSRRRSRTLAGAAPGCVESSEGSDDCRCRRGFPEGALRRSAPLRPLGERTFSSGNHAG